MIVSILVGTLRNGVVHIKIHTVTDAGRMYKNIRHTDISTNTIYPIAVHRQIEFVRISDYNFSQFRPKTKFGVTILLIRINKRPHLVIY